MYCPKCDKANTFRIENENGGLLFRCMYCQNHFKPELNYIITLLNNHFSVLNKIDDLQKLLERVKK